MKIGFVNLDRLIVFRCLLGKLNYFLFIWALLFSCSSYSQTPQPQNPQGANQPTVPLFSAVSASLSSSITYGIAISESPRGGSSNQYANFWTKAGVSAADLLESNLNRLRWSSSWEHRIRSGGYDAPVTQIIQGSPLSLDLGKTYYWHIVGSDGTKSAEASFTVGNVPSQPDLTVLPNLNRNLFAVSWTAVANATRYELTRNSATVNIANAQLSSSIYKLDVSVLSLGVNETFNIKACNSFGCSSGQNKIANYPVPPTTAVIQSPSIGALTNNIPTFVATASSLQSNAIYTIVISEAPRAGLNNQFVNFWVSPNLTNGQIAWGSNWQQRTRNGNPDGDAQVIQNSSPPTLTNGKTYYWHIVGLGTNGGVSKSVQGQFTVGTIPAQPDLAVSPNFNRNLFVVNWNAVANTTRYELTRNNNAINITNASLSGSIYKLEIDVFSPGVDEVFTIKACNSLGCSEGQSKIGNYPVPPAAAALQSPTGGIQTNYTPIFKAIGLQVGATYTVAISEAPRAGMNSQFVNFWVSSNLINGQVAWGSNWQQRTRNGNPDGEAQVVNNTSPLTLTSGKTYYWHVVGIGTNGGISKSDQGQFTVEAITNNTHFSNGTGLGPRIGSTTPCFSWNVSLPYKSTIEVFTNQNGVKTLFAKKAIASSPACLDKSWTYSSGVKPLPLDTVISWQIKTYLNLESDIFAIKTGEDFHTRPNIVIVYADDLGWDDVNTSVGNGVVTTTDPGELTNFSQQTNAVTFGNAYANAAICAPSRASLLSGKYPVKHRVYSVNKAAKKDIPVFTEPKVDNGQLLSEHLKNAGYATALIGKWHLFGATSDTGTVIDLSESSEWRATKKGFNINWAGNQSGKPRAYERNINNVFEGDVDVSYFPVMKKVYFPLNQENDTFDPQLFSAEDGLANETDLSNMLGAITKRYISHQNSYTLLDSKKLTQPFFIYNALYDPHLPVPVNDPACPDKDINNAETAANYTCMMKRVDKALKNVLDGIVGDGDNINLDKTNSTYVVFTSDNGTNAKIAPLYTGRLKGYKGQAYEGGVRVPLVIAGPGITFNKIKDTPVITSDLYSTLLGLAGIQVSSSDVDSKDLRALLLTYPTTASVAVPAAPDFTRPLFWYNPIVHHTDINALSGANMAVRSGKYKLINHFYPHSIGEGFNKKEYLVAELYDLSQDPKENCNLLDVPSSSCTTTMTVPEIKNEYLRLSNLLREHVAQVCVNLNKDEPSNFTVPLPGAGFKVYKLSLIHI